METWDGYVFRVRYSDEDRKFVATVDELPSLSWLADSRTEALRGLRRAMDAAAEDMGQSEGEAAVPSREFHAEDYLLTEEDVVEFLNAAAEETAGIDDDAEAADFLVAAIGDAVKARRRMEGFVRGTAVDGESLCESLRAGEDPSFRTVFGAIRELGGELTIIRKRQRSD